VWQGREYVISECIHGGQIQLKDQLTNNVTTVKAVALVQLLFQGDLQFLEVDACSGNQNNRLAYMSADFTQVSPELRESAKRRYSYVARVLELTRQKLTDSNLKPIIEQVSNEIEDTDPPSGLTVYRWVKDYLASGKDIRSLIPKHIAKGNRKSRLEPEVKKIITNAISQVYLKPEQASGSDVYDRVIIEINQCNRIRSAVGTEKLEIPNIAAIYRAINKLDSYEKASCRYGLSIASQMYDPVLNGPRPTRPLERVEIDHTKLPLFVVDTENRLPIGTPWLTSAIDKYSGVTLGYYASFEPPSYLSVMQCLLHAIRPKNYLHTQYPSVENTWDAYGLPEVIVVDNGKEFYSTHFEDACLQLGIVIQYSPPKMPWYKSAIERYFGALNSQLLSDKPGKSFSNFLMKYDYDPLKNAVVSFEALQEMLHIFIVDIHHQSSHPELKSPRADVWKTAISSFPPALPPSSQELLVLIGNITTRKITRRGVEFEGLYYNSCELARLRSSNQESEKTIVKYDPTNISRIYVFDSKEHKFLEVPALAQEYTHNLSLWQHQVVKQLARQSADKVDIVALALAKEKIQRIVEQEWKTTKKGKTRTAMARWLGIGSEELNTGNQELSPPEQIPNLNLIRGNGDAPQVDNSSSSTIEITGISELGSAFNSHPSPEANSSAVTVEENKVDNNNTREVGPVSVGAITQKKQKRSPDKKSTPSDLTELVSVSAALADEWKPDLSGWDVSIGLPSSL
jgi:putative transposase